MSDASKEPRDPGARPQCLQDIGVASGRVDDLYWLRCEMEARIDRRYCWSPSALAHGAAAETVVQLCPSEAAGLMQVRVRETLIGRRHAGNRSAT